MMTKKRYLIPEDFHADPSVHIFNGKIHIYPSHDWDNADSENDNGDQYDMKDYHCFTIDGDPMTGKVIDHGVILSVEDIPWAGRQLWDCDIQERDGKYYLYFPLKDRNDIFRMGVAIADKPTGPFKCMPYPIHGSYSIDYACLKDDKDGEYYMYFGGIWGGQLQRYVDNKAVEAPYLPQGKEKAISPRVVKMNKDMVSFAEEPKAIKIVDEKGEELTAENPYRFFEASWMHKYKGKYYFSYSTGDTHMICYAVGDNPYGPFTYQGVVLTPVAVGWTTHHCIVEWEGKWYLFHHDSVPSGKSWLRSLKVCELEYDENGKIKTIEGADK
ncbi:MAG: glycoside hydrolase family 43 protein [Marinilabiliaceae bacterium]|nr:glycoside hydrolase family 43 protein [Marinilabiliaceae bacterium]